MTRIKFLVCLATTLLFFCCTDNDDGVLKGCGFDNPRQELPWLKRRIDSMAASTSTDMVYCYVVQSQYKNRTVFRFEDCNPVISKVVFTLNCDGNRIDSNDDIIFLEELKNPKVIWKPDDFACQVNF